MRPCKTTQEYRETSFQSTHPRGVRLRRSISFRLVRSFNPRTREGCDTACIKVYNITPKFQSTHPRGVRRRFRQARRLLGCFNPRTREGCDEVKTFKVPHDVPFQSTHPRGVRPLNDLKTRIEQIVSIHAPARGATRTSGIFIQGRKFQSTHPRGVRLDDKLRACICRSVSIHAPARGATMSLTVSRCPFHRFNPRTREGCDACLASTSLNVSSFNPRTREGCDFLLTLCSIRPPFVSIHAPARGATIKKVKINSFCIEFQSTHPRGVRPFGCSVKYSAVCRR